MRQHVGLDVSLQRCVSTLLLRPSSFLSEIRTKSSVIGSRDYRHVLQIAVPGSEFLHLSRRTATTPGGSD